MPPSNRKEGNQDLPLDRKEDPLKDVPHHRDNHPGNTRIKEIIGNTGKPQQGRIPIGNNRGVIRIWTDNSIPRDRIIKEDLQGRTLLEFHRDRIIRGEPPDHSSKDGIQGAIIMTGEAISNKGEDPLLINIGTPGISTGTLGINIDGILKDSTTKKGWLRRSNRTVMHHLGTEDLLRDSRQPKGMAGTSAPTAEGRYTETRQAASSAVGAVIWQMKGSLLTIPEDRTILRIGTKGTVRNHQGAVHPRDGNVVWRTG